MDSGGGFLKIEKLGESNFHVWKQKVELLFAFRELDGHIDETATRPDRIHRTGPMAEE